jgi:antitoxin VapB
MALNIKNLEVERLAGEVAKLAHETKTEAIRRALAERKARLASTHGRPQSQERLIEFFEKSIWSQVPADVLGKPLSKQEREEILGYGPEGV